MALSLVDRGRGLIALCLGLGLPLSCTVVDKGDYTFSDTETGGSAGRTVSGGNGGSGGTSLGGEGGETVTTGGKGGRGGAGGTAGATTGGSSGAAGEGGEGGMDTMECTPNATRCAADGRLATCHPDGRGESTSSCPRDSNPCTDDVCDPETDDCGHLPAASGTMCSTSSVPDGVCVGTRCECGAAGQPCCEAPDECEDADYVCGTGNICRSICDDDNPCTVDVLVGGTGGTCTHDPAPATTSCREAAGACDEEEFCDGVTTTCPSDEIARMGATCRPANGTCDLAETCDGNSVDCPADGFQPAMTECRASTGDCDVAEVCTGTSGACPTDRFRSSSTECRASAGACDPAENCTGSSANCPSDELEPMGTTCRASAGTCDVAEVCNGNSVSCPANVFRDSTTECRASAGVCDVAENCTGSSADCPANAFVPGTTECRSRRGTCDVAETCTGSSADCPGDALSPATTVCRSSAGVCDVAENCTGNSVDCPGDAFVSVVSVCRAAAGQCDIQETCTGTDAACPDDVFKDNGTVCRDTTYTACDPSEKCTGSEPRCPPDANTCGGTCFSAAVDVYQRDFGLDPAKPQFTRCESLTYGSNGAVTCNNPVVRYGTVPNGVPKDHPNNSYDTWCQQLGCSNYVANSVTFGTRTCLAPSGGLFWSASYDDPPAKWADWQDGVWFNELLEYHDCTAAITSITCQGTVHNDGFGHSWDDGNPSATYGPQAGIEACRAWSIANDVDPSGCTSTSCSCTSADLCAYNNLTAYNGVQRYVWFYAGPTAGTVTADCCGCSVQGNWR